MKNKENKNWRRIQRENMIRNEAKRRRDERDEEKVKGGDKLRTMKTD